MTKAEMKQRIEEVRSLFGEPGWQYLSEGWSEELERLKTSTLTDARTEQELYFRKGAADVLARLVHMDTLLDAVEASLDEAEAEE